MQNTSFYLQVLYGTYITLTNPIFFVLFYIVGRDVTMGDLRKIQQSLPKKLIPVTKTSASKDETDTVNTRSMKKLCVCACVRVCNLCVCVTVCVCVCVCICVSV